MKNKSSLKNRIISTSLTVILLAGLLCGCGFSENSTSMLSYTPINFSWWGNDDRHEYTMDGVDIFMDKNPDISVKYQYGVWQGYEKRNRVVMKSGTQADVMQINYSWLDEFSRDGNGYYDLKDLSEYIDLTNYSEEYLSYGTRNGHLNALPIALNSTILFYNKDIWDSYGLALPETWDDLFEAARIMSPDGVYPLGVVKKMAFLICVANFEQTHNKSVVSKDGAFILSEEEIGDLLDFYRRLVDEKVILPVDDFDKQKLGQDKLAGTLCWISDTGNYGEIMAGGGHTPAVGEYLVADSDIVRGWYMKPSTMYAISKNTRHPKEAARLVDYLVNSPDMAVLQGCEKGVPVSITARNTLKINNMLSGYEYSADEYMNDNISSLSLMPAVLESDELISKFKSAGDDYIYEKATRERCAISIKNEFGIFTRIKNK